MTIPTEEARRELAEALRRSENRYSSLVRATGMIVWITDAEGMAIDIPGWRATTGQTAEETRGDGWANALHPDDRRRALESWRRAVALKTFYETEYRVRRYDGEYRLMEVRGVPVLEEDGRISEWVGACVDITERRRAEEQLRSASAYTRSLIEASLDPLVTIDAQGKITDVNEATVRATGAPRERLIGSDFADYFTDPEKARAGYREVFAKGFVTDFALAIRSVSGQVMDILYNASLYRDPSGAVKGVFAAARDVTERNRAEGQLRSASAYTRTLIEVSLDPLVTIDARGKITDVNEATVRATGVARKRLIGSDFADYFTEPEKARAGYGEVFTKGFVTDYPLAIRSASGQVMDVLYNASVYRDASGEVAGVFAAARDVTERKRAEDEVRRLNAELEQRVKDRTAELEAAVKELETFSYSVSHDLRTPLRAIDGFSRILVEDYGPKLDDEARRIIGVVRASTAKMSTLIDDILAFSRVGRQGMRETDVDMGALVQEALQELEPVIEDRKIAITVKPLPNARGDAPMLARVWTNLLDNAVKFTAPKRDGVIEVGGEVRAGEAVYYVKDNGVGFDMAFSDKLFGLFQRLHGSGEFSGTGIGLAIAKRIVTRHNGRIWAEGEVDEGATFSFALPLGEGV